MQTMHTRFAHIPKRIYKNHIVHCFVFLGMFIFYICVYKNEHSESADVRGSDVEDGRR